MERPKEEVPLAEQLSRIQEDIRSLARELKIPPREILGLLSHRELVILNTQLRSIHEMLDLLYAEKAKGKGEKR